MAENFFVVFGQTAGSMKLPPNPKHGAEGKVLEPPSEATFVKLEAANVAEAQHVVQEKFAGSVTTTPIVVKEASWKSS